MKLEQFDQSGFTEWLQKMEDVIVQEPTQIDHPLMSPVMRIFLAGHWEIVRVNRNTLDISMSMEMNSLYARFLEWKEAQNEHN